MKNGFFQLVNSQNKTGIKIYPPFDGGQPVKPQEVMDYLVMQNVVYDAVAIGKAVAAAVNQPAVEIISMDPMRPVRECYKMVIGQDRMQVFARFYAASENGERMSETEFLRDLSQKKIVYGIDTDMIHAFFSNPSYCTDVIIAEGDAPRHGKDAEIEYFFNTDLQAKPTLQSDGSVDFFNLNTINHCKKGDVLAKIIPEDSGDYGTTVYGEKVKPRDIKKLSLKYGRNIHLSDDRRIITSEVDGHVTLVEDKVFVADVLTVENVDNSTGNINFEGSVQINGNVCTNFSVVAKGNIEVKGVVEGAYLESGGDIIIARGMNGMGKGSLKAEGNIVAKYMENTKAVAKGYVSSESLLHSVVMAGTDITVTGKKGFITGGKVSAGNSVTVKTLGSPMGADTIIEVGVDPTIKIRMMELQKSIAELAQAIKQAQPILEATTKKLAQGIKLHPDQVKYIQALVVKNKENTLQLKEQSGELRVMQDSLEGAAKAFVAVTGEVYSGTKICISDVSMVVKQSFKYCKFVKKQGDVKMEGL